MAVSAALLAEIDRCLATGESLTASALGQTLREWPEDEALPEPWLLCEPSSLRPHPALELIPGQPLDRRSLDRVLSRMQGNRVSAARDLIRTPLSDSAPQIARQLSRASRGGRLDHGRVRPLLIVLCAALVLAPGQVSRAQALALMSSMFELIGLAAQLLNRQVVWLCMITLLLLVRNHGLPTSSLRNWAGVGFEGAQSVEQREVCAVLLLAGEGPPSPLCIDAIEQLSAPKERAHSLKLCERILIDAGESKAATRLVQASLAQLERYVDEREPPSCSEELFAHFDRERAALSFVRSPHGRAGLSLARLAWGLAHDSSAVRAASLTSARVYGPGAASLTPRVLELARSDPRSWLRARAWRTLPAVVDASEHARLRALLERGTQSDPIGWVDAERSVASDMVLSGWQPSEGAP